MLESVLCSLLLQLNTIQKKKTDRAKVDVLRPIIAPVGEDRYQHQIEGKDARPDSVLDVLVLVDHAAPLEQLPIVV